jgi:hypothetical protein
VFKFWPAILLTSCATTYNHTPEDTKFNETKKDWIEIYGCEIKTAIENEDAEAYHFFTQELIKEKVRVWKKTKAK